MVRDIEMVKLIAIE